MGFETTIIVRNDALDCIRRDPQGFVENMLNAIATINHNHGEPLDFHCQGHGNPAMVVETHHADSTVLVAAGGNAAEVVGHIFRWRWDDEKSKHEDLVRALDYHLRGERT